MVAEAEASGERQPISDETIRLTGYVLFFWISIFLTPPYLEQPDILVFLFYLLATSLCMQLVAGKREIWRFALLGLVLGMAYLVKAIMFPLGFVFIAALFLGRDRRRLLPKLLLAFVVFAAVSSPFIFALSKSKGRLTYGDVGAVAYRHIMGWDAESQQGGARVNSLCGSKQTASPHLYEYTEKISLGTYPPWADPSYDYKGAPLRFDLRKQINRTHVVLRDYFALYAGQLGALICGFLVLLIWTGSYREYARRLGAQYVLWFPALAGLFFYSLLRVEGRMLAGFTIGLFAAGAAALRISHGEQGQRFARSVALAVSVVLLSEVAINAGHDSLGLFGHDRFPDLQVANTLEQMGVGPDDRVGYLGYALTDHGWAHLARVTISAEIPEEDVSTFWAADQADRAQALLCVSATGAKALVTRNVPGTALAMGWRRVGESEYYVLKLADSKSN
jgi:hypothetical protein